MNKNRTAGNIVKALNATEQSRRGSTKKQKSLRKRVKVVGVGQKTRWEWR